MPKKKNKNDVLYSLKYVYDQTLLNKNAQRELFIFTQDKSYFNNPSGVPRNPESFTEEQKEKGYFTVKEKQWALWHDTHPAKSDSVKSRGLSQYADAYEKFYKAVYDGTEEGKYKNLVHALPVDMKTGKPVENSPEMAGNITETVTDELDGDTNLKTFEYKKSLFQADTKNNCYVIGPYCIDYSLDDETGDVFKTTDGYDLRYNSIEDIKVYNQDKKNIEDLGGSFKLAYKYDGELKEEDEAKVHHINDETYLELTNGNEVKTDWEEIPGFDSRKPFYIIVYRGDMKLEDFKGFYAKITFQYIDHIEGTVEKYKGQVYEYYFTSMTRAS